MSIFLSFTNDQKNKIKTHFLALLLKLMLFQAISNRYDLWTKKLLIKKDC